MIGELVIVVLGSLFWCAIGYGIGFKHGWKDGSADTWEAVRRSDDAARRVAQLSIALKCPVCGAGRSNDEIARGWCANCGVYHDG